MDLEYLIVGIAKGNDGDLAEFCKKTESGVFGLALAYTKDRFFARAIAVEAYKRVKKYAYKFDTEMNAEYWVLDIVKNLSINALCDGELTKLAAENHLENVSNVLRQAICDTDEDRGRIMVLRTATGLSKSEIARLLWYNGASCNSEFSRGIKQLVAMEPERRDNAGVKEALAEDIKECTPDDIFEKVVSENETVVSKVSHKNYMIGDDEFALPGESKENRKQRLEAQKAKSRKKKVIAACIAAGLVVIVGASVLIWWFAKNGDTNLEDPQDTLNVTEPQYNTRVALAEHDGILYFQNLADGGALYSLDLKKDGAKAEKLCDDAPKEMVIYKDYIYYRSVNDGKLYRRAINAEQGSASEKFSVNGAILRIVKDKIYYSSASGISVMDLDGSEPKVILDDNTVSREDIEVTEDGIVYFSSGHTPGLFRLVPQEDGNYTKEVLLDDQTEAFTVYDFFLIGDDCYYDMQDGFKTGSVHVLEIDDEGYARSPEKLGATLISSAFFVKDGYVYYYGCSSVSEVGIPKDKGIYRIAVEVSGEAQPELLLDMTDNEQDISYIYVSDDYIYCYYSNGKKAAEDSYYRLEKYDLNEDGSIKGDTAEKVFLKD